jgi:hypothetical protein
MVKNILKWPQKYAMAIKLTKLATKTLVGDEIHQNKVYQKIKFTKMATKILVGDEIHQNKVYQKNKVYQNGNKNIGRR